MNDEGRRSPERPSHASAPTNGSPITAVVDLRRFRDGVAQVVRAQEALEDGDQGFAHELMVNAEVDLITSLAEAA